MSIKGNTAKCFAHYVAKLPPKGSKTIGLVRRPLKDFCNVGDAALGIWMRDPGKKKMPIGEPLLKLRFFLELMGYEVQELTELQPVIYRLASMIAFGAVTAADAQAYLGYTDHNAINRMVLGRGSALKDKLAKINELWDLHKDEVEQKRKSWSAAIGTGQYGLAAATVHRVEQPEPLSGGTRRNGELEMLGHLILAMLPLAERVASDSCSAQDRRDLRQMVGNDGVFHLSTALNALCGEEARKQVLNSKGGK